jgi:hypothetical protein
VRARHQREGVARLDGARAQHAEVPARAAGLPGQRGEVLEGEAVVELEAGLAGEGDLEEDGWFFLVGVWGGGGGGGRASDGDGVADAAVALVEVGGDEVLAEAAGLEGCCGGGVLGGPGWVVGGAVWRGSVCVPPVKGMWGGWTYTRGWPCRCRRGR